nr:MAG TPA: hypothetical protein [Caudoviricetes sp.]
MQSGFEQTKSTRKLMFLGVFFLVDAGGLREPRC